MDIISIVNTMQPNTIAKLAKNASDFPNGESSVPFMGMFVQLFQGAALPDPVMVMAYQPTYDALISAQQTAQQAKTALPDVPTQLANLTAALLTANIIPQSALPITQITAVNNKLAEIGATPIAITIK